MSWGKKSKDGEPVDGTMGPLSETTYIDRGCEMTGELRFRDNVRIDGHVEGEIRCDKTVVIGDDATVRAHIKAANVIIHGCVEGDVEVSGETTLHKSSSVTGELKTGGIVVERGAQLRGCILISGVEGDSVTRNHVSSEGEDSRDLFGLDETGAVPVAE